MHHEYDIFARYFLFSLLICRITYHRCVMYLQIKIQEYKKQNYFIRKNFLKIFDKFFKNLLKNFIN